MFGRLLLKVIVFIVIIGYFTLYEYNHKTTPANEISHVSTLLLYEQRLLKQLNIQDNEQLTESHIEQHNIPYIEGTLMEITSLSEHIISVKIHIKNTHLTKLKHNQFVVVNYIGQFSDAEGLILNKNYKWLIQEGEAKNEGYYLQGGKRGIISLQ